MADSDWKSVISQKKKRRNREDELREERLRAEASLRPHRTRDLAWFQNTHPPPSGTNDEYTCSHARIWGAEEGMIDGEHRRGKQCFPNGSARDIAHTCYSKSKDESNKAEKTYDNADKRHRADFEILSLEEQTYYKDTSKGLLPLQHADLSGRALDLADAARKHGSQRTDFEDRFEFPHHSLSQAVKHHDYAENAFKEHRAATKDHQRHEIHRCSEVDDGQRDCYGRRVVAGTHPHTRSREHGVPPAGYYSAYPDTPPVEEEANTPPVEEEANTPPVEEEEKIDWWFHEDKKT